MRILLVEDDLVLADGLKNSLIQSGYAVDLANSGADADGILAYQSYDLVVLDLGLPKLGGFEVLKRLRARGSKMPVLILTANDDVDNRVKGLDLGADDYLSKPFVLAELEARVRALIRRGQTGGVVDKGKPAPVVGHEVRVVERHRHIPRAGQAVRGEQAGGRGGGSQAGVQPQHHVGVGLQPLQLHPRQQVGAPPTRPPHAPHPKQPGQQPRLGPQQPGERKQGHR